MNIYYSSSNDVDLLQYKYNECIETYKNYGLYTFKRNKDSIGTINVDNINPNGIIIKDFESCYLQYWEIVKLFTIPKNVILFINESNNGALYKIKKLYKIIDLLDLTVSYINLNEVFIDKEDVKKVKNTLYEKFNLSEFILMYSTELCLCANLYYNHDIDLLTDLFNTTTRTEQTLLLRRIVMYVLLKAGLPTKVINDKFNYKDSQSTRNAIIRFNNEYHKLDNQQIDSMNFLIKQAESIIKNY